MRCPRFSPISPSSRARRAPVFFSTNRALPYYRKIQRVAYQCQDSTQELRAAVVITYGFGHLGASPAHSPPHPPTQPHHHTRGLCIANTKRRASRSEGKTFRRSYVGPSDPLASLSILRAKSFWVVVGERSNPHGRNTVFMFLFGGEGEEGRAIPHDPFLSCLTEAKVMDPTLRERTLLGIGPAPRASKVTRELRSLV